MGRDWIVVQVPYGGGYSSLNLAHTPGTKRAPKALKKKFMRQRIFMADNGISSWDNIRWLEIPLGLGRKNNPKGWEKMHKSVVSYLKNLYCELNLTSDVNMLFLGGSHSVTSSTYIGASQMLGRQQTGIIVLDAHPDCCSKANWPIHSDWLRWLIEDEYVLPENVLLVGLRQIQKSEKEFLDKFNIRHYCMNDIKDANNFTINNLLIIRFLERLQALSAIYLSIDIDVASGAFAPGTGCPSPGGFTDTELINLVKQFKAVLPNLRAADIVEINPLKWWQKKVLRYDPTVDLGVKLIKEIIS